MSDTGKPKHIVHLSYTLVRPKYTDPGSWLARVAFVSGVAEKLATYGPQTVIYNIHYQGEIQRGGVRYLFPAFKRWQLVLPFAYNRFIKKLKPDVILIHGLIFPWQIIMLRKVVGANVTIICQHHADRPFRDFRKFIFRWADRYVGAYLFASRTYGEEWVKAKLISSMAKVHEVMGMSSIFYPENKRKERGGYLWIGDLDHNKDPLLAARAFQKFAAQHKDALLYMIYQGTDLVEELKQVAATTPCIRLVGKVEHAKLQDWFNRTDYMISSSHYESAGIAVCEGLSCGCIPILTNIPSFRMMTGNGSIGKLFEAGNEDELYRALEETYTIDRSAESKRVIEHFNAGLSFEANARKIMNVINSI